MIAKFARRSTLGLFATAFGNNIQQVFSFSIARKITSKTQTLSPTKSTFDSALSALNFAQPEEKENERDESLAYWKEMYQQGEKFRQEQIFAMTSGISDSIQSEGLSSTTKVPIRVVSFDLDNTLWKTSKVIGTANDELAVYLSTKKKQNGEDLKIPKRIEKVMGDLFRADRRKYCPLVGATIPVRNDDEAADDKTENIDELLEEKLKSPVLLTQLRIDALCHVLKTENDFSSKEALSFAEDAFGVWTTARHDAILDHLAPRVVETLNDIRTNIATSCENSANDIPVLMGAVTDGNSDPRIIESLAPYFDFCVNAESVGVSKPDRRVYLEAIRQAIKLRPDLFSDLLPLQEFDGDGDDLVATMDEEKLENIVGPYWCHIGDDFLKDVVAAKDMKMRTIFAIELVKDKLLANVTTSKDSELDMVGFLKQVSSQTVVTLGIGADDYLANSLHREFVDEVAEEFSDIGRILSKWQKEADNAAATNGGPTPGNGEKAESTQPLSETTNGEDKEQDILEMIEPSSKDDIDGLPVTPIVNKNQEGEVDFLIPRAFRIVREECSIDVPAPLRKREEYTMKDVMGMAQMDKSSGVFAFDPAEVASLNEGKKVLKVAIGDTDLEFSRDIFSRMTVEEVLSLTDENPLKLELYMANASEQPSFDLF
mmetsp:Transcript_926/g.1962  ORF Transcript_926/g.1962 Transcript_926/m.1962 type:complete len:656 (+) Transcript_926:241-2208(+)